MNDSTATLLDEASLLAVNSSSRNRLEDRVLETTGITNMTQLAVLVEAVARRAAIENGDYGDHDTAEALFAGAQTISESLRRLHELIRESA